MMIVLPLLAVIVISHMSVSIPERIAYHDNISTERSLVEESCEDRDCIFVYDDWNTPHYGRDFELMKYQQLHFADVDDIDSEYLKQLQNNRKNTDNKLAVFVRSTIENPDEIAQMIEEDMDGKGIELISLNDFYIYNID